VVVRQCSIKGMKLEKTSCDDLIMLNVFDYNIQTVFKLSKKIGQILRKISTQFCRDIQNILLLQKSIH